MPPSREGLVAMRVDLHTHTTMSDGTLTPRELLERAAAMSIRLLSVTDHDTVRAYSQLVPGASDSLTLVGGVEFSTQWRRVGVHVLGLNVSLDSDALGEGVRHQQALRLERAARIAHRLERLGLGACLDRVRVLAGEGSIGRPHFARHLVAIGAVSTLEQAFGKYLGAGRPANVRLAWASLGEVVGWIRGAGGTAVLAHPAKYRLTRTKLLALLDDFIEAGGQGMEVVSGQQTGAQTRDLASLCIEKRLLASCGSDFHQPGQPWAELGRVTALPSGCRPVWDCW